MGSDAKPEMFSQKMRIANQAQAKKLEELFCGRAALLAGAIEGDASAGFGLKLDGGMAYDLGEGHRCSLD